MHIYAYLYIFRHVYECVCNMYIWYIFVHICVLYAYLYIFTHISIHKKTLICWQWKIMQPGYTPQGVEISASTLNIHLSISITGSIDIHSNAEPEWPHGTAVGSALAPIDILSKWGIPERDIWSLHVMVQGPYQIWIVLGTSPPPSPSSGKCLNMRKCTLFPKWACLKFPEMLIWQK